MSKLGGTVRFNTASAAVNPGPPAVSNVDFSLTSSLPTAPFAGVAVITINAYVGFGAGNGLARIRLFTDTYPAPSGAGWSVETQEISLSAGAWSMGGTCTIFTPVAKGARPNATARIAFTATSVFVGGVATVLFHPGAWPGNP